MRLTSDEKWARGWRPVVMCSVLTTEDMTEEEIAARIAAAERDANADAGERFLRRLAAAYRPEGIP